MAEHEHAAVIRAIADKGFEAGEWQHPFGEWRAAHYFVNPLSHPQLQWRIKPEPKPDVVTYLYKSMGEWRENDKRRFSSEGEVIMIVRNAEGELKSAEVLP